MKTQMIANSDIFFANAIDNCKSNNTDVRFSISSEKGWYTGITIDDKINLICTFIKSIWILKINLQIKTHLLV